MAECKACGHRDTQHAKFGCNQGFCKCELSNQDVIDFEKLAALREAGEKMKTALEDIKLGIYLYGADIEAANAALEAWEAANK